MPWKSSAIIIAHRGLHRDWPENSLPAFAAAEAAGIGFLECDVWASADGVPVILHDQTLDRTTRASGNVFDYRASELSAFGVPTLAELIAQSSPETTLVVEIKPDNSAELVRSVVELLGRRHPRIPSSPCTQGEDRGGGFVLRACDDRTEITTAFARLPPQPSPGVPGEGEHPLAIVQSFDLANVEHCRRLAPEISVALLIEDAACLERKRLVPIHVRHDLLDDRLVKSHHAAGLAVGAWTVNRPAEIQVIFAMGVDRIISDDPLLCQRILADLELET